MNVYRKLTLVDRLQKKEREKSSVNYLYMCNQPLKNICSNLICCPKVFRIIPILKFKKKVGSLTKNLCESTDRALPHTK